MVIFSISSFGIVGGTQANFRLFDCCTHKTLRGEKETLHNVFLFSPGLRSSRVYARARTHIHTHTRYYMYLYIYYYILIHDVYTYCTQIPIWPSTLYYSVLCSIHIYTHRHTTNSYPSPIIHVYVPVCARFVRNKFIVFFGMNSRRAQANKFEYTGVKNRGFEELPNTNRGGPVYTWLTWTLNICVFMYT